jgi:hypothetical protein
MWFPDADTIAFSEGGTERMRIDSSGNVGIGTSSPSRKLHVVGPGGTAANQSTGTTSALYFGDTNSSSIDNQGIQLGNDMFISAGGLERMRIDSSGRLNIGTSTSISGSLLNIDGGFINADVTDNSHKFIRSTANTTGLNDSLLCKVKTTGNMVDGFASVITFALEDSSDVNNNLGFIGATRSGADNSGSLIFHTFNSGSQAERMRITSSGNVGIGTSSPDKLLTVASNSGTSVPTIRILDTNVSPTTNDVNGSLEFYTNDGDGEHLGAYISCIANEVFGRVNSLVFGVSQSNTADATEALRIQSNGKIGIGTTSPDAKLSVDGVASFGDGSAAAPSIANFGNLNTGMWFPAADTIAFSEGGTEAMRINSSGQVGIGSTNPNRTLVLDATSGSNFELKRSPNSGGLYFETDGTDGVMRSVGATGSLIFQTNGTNERMRINSSGNVGIGTTAPDAKLSVNGVASFGDGTALLPSIANFGDLNTGMWFPDADTIAFSEGGAEAMRIDSSGFVGIGLTNPAAQLHVNTNSTGRSNVYFSNFNTSGGISSQEVAIGFQFNRTGGGINLSAARVVAGKEREWVGAASNQDGFLAFETCLNESVSEKMRITSSGDVFIAKTGTAIGTVGIELDSTGSGAFTTSAVPVLYVNRLTDDGDLIRFFQASTEEGSISVSGGTVSYNGFTGTHWSRFTDNSTPNILRGTVLETLDEMCDWYNLEFDVINQDDEGNDVTTTEKVPHVLTDTQSIGDTVTYNHEGTDVQATIVKETDIKHMMSKVSDTVDAKNVYGVFVAYDNDGDGYNDFYVASVGSFVVRIKANETIAKGDLLQSNGDGTAKVQTDDAVRSSSFAKVLSTTIIETYEDGSYLVPCSLMC